MHFLAIYIVYNHVYLIMRYVFFFFRKKKHETKTNLIIKRRIGIMIIVYNLYNIPTDI